MKPSNHREGGLDGWEEAGMGGMEVGRTRSKPGNQLVFTNTVNKLFNKNKCQVLRSGKNNKIYVIADTLEKTCLVKFRGCVFILLKTPN